MTDGIGLAEALLGLDGFRVLEVNEAPDELVITIETSLDVVGCRRCGTRAQAQDRMPILPWDAPPPHKGAVSRLCDQRSEKTHL